MALTPVEMVQWRGAARRLQVPLAAAIRDAFQPVADRVVPMRKDRPNWSNRG